MTGYGFSTVKPGDRLKLNIKKIDCLQNKRFLTSGRLQITDGSFWSTECQMLGAEGSLPKG